MARQLRPRKAPVNYRPEEGVAGLGIDDQASGSDFDPGEEPDVPADQNNSQDEEMEADEDENQVDTTTPRSKVKAATTGNRKSVSFTPASITPTKRKRKAAQSITQGANIIGAGFIRRASSSTSTPSKGKSKGPSPHHRHRAVPLYSHTFPVESLSSKPSSPFSRVEKKEVKSFSSNTVVGARISKAWALNVGPGPLWELIEDRGWYKSAIPGKASEPLRRPRVFEDVQGGEWEVLDKGQATVYLPSSDQTTEDGALQPPKPITCFLGPIGSQTRVSLSAFDTKCMSEFIEESTSHIFCVGAPIWGLDWCPIHPSDREKYHNKSYLAVAPFPSMKHSPEIGTKLNRPSSACIQLWSFGPAEELDGIGEKGRVKCELILCVDTGPALEIKWCPLPSNSPAPSTVKGKEKEGDKRKLGLLAGTFEDGSLSVFAVPDPVDFETEQGPIFVKIPPILRIELEDTSCWSLDWANSEILAVGTTNGSIAVYDIAEAIRNPAKEPELEGRVLPRHYIANVHQTGIRSLSWIRVPPSETVFSSGEEMYKGQANPSVIASGGYDGAALLTDLRDGRSSLVNRTRDVITAIEYGPYNSGFITLDHENSVKAYSVSPTMLGRGQTIMEAGGPIWDIATSDYHPQIAVGSADGACSTTNGLRSSRRGGSVPFFIHKVYQLDYSRKTGEYRMLEKFLPTETVERPSMKAQKVPVGTGAWSSQIGVHRVVWNDKNGLESAGVLASGTAAGIVRIDRLEGRWFCDRVPYGSVGAIRGETSRGSDEEEEDEEDEESEADMNVD